MKTNTYKFKKDLLDKTKDRKSYMHVFQRNHYTPTVFYFPELKAERKILVPMKKDKYEELQSSRGISVNGTETRRQLLDKVRKEIEEPNYADLERMNELMRYANTAKNCNIKRVVEIGFRIPRVLEMYRRVGCDVFGYDVVDFNTKVAQDLGYNCRTVDFSDQGGQNPEEINTADLVVCYHVLEHMPRPDIALRNIYKNMKKGSLFHVEIPVEPGVPNFQAGHMFPFHPDDMQHFLLHTGFRIHELKVGFSTTHPNMERYLVSK